MSCTGSLPLLLWAQTALLTPCPVHTPPPHASATPAPPTLDRYLTHILLQQLQHPELRPLACLLLTRLIQHVVTSCVAAGAATASAGAPAGTKGRSTAAAAAGSGKGGNDHEAYLEVLLGDLMGPMVSGLLGSLGAPPRDAAGACPGRRAVLALLTQLTVQVGSAGTVQVIY